MTRRIRFEFSLEKFAAVMAYLVHEGRIHDLTKLKAAKLLFFADKAHLLKYGRPIIGDRYVSMDHGPAPSAALELMNRLVAPDEIPDPVRDQLNQTLSVHRRPFGHHPFRAKAHGKDVNDRLSDSEREVLDEVIRTYGHKSAGELVDLAHREHAWRVSDRLRPAGSSWPMPYETFFEGEQSTSSEALRQFAEEQQEDRDFIAALT